MTAPATLPVALPDVGGSVDHDFDPVATRIVGAGRMLGHGHGLADGRGTAGSDRPLASLEHLGRRRAVGLHEVDLQVEQQPYYLIGGILDFHLDADFTADRDARRIAGNAPDSRRGVRTVAKHGQRVGVPLFDQGPQAVPHQTLVAGAALDPPAPRDLDGQVGMVLGDVVEIVRHRATDILLGVVFQELE